MLEHDLVEPFGATRGFEDGDVGLRRMKAADVEHGRTDGYARTLAGDKGVRQRREGASCRLRSDAAHVNLAVLPGGDHRECICVD